LVFAGDCARGFLTALLGAVEEHAMTLEDFYIGCEFTSAYRPTPYRCTDVGTRVIVATIIDEDSDHIGGHAMEFVFQPYEFEHCKLLEI
jgi:hypothetical protein